MKIVVQKVQACQLVGVQFVLVASAKTARRQRQERQDPRDNAEDAPTVAFWSGLRVGDGGIEGKRVGLSYHTAVDLCPWKMCQYVGQKEICQFLAAADLHAQICTFTQTNTGLDFAAGLELPTTFADAGFHRPPSVH